MKILRFQRQIAVVYNVEDGINKINYMKELGFLEHEIYLFTQNIRPFQSIKMYTEINVHQSGNMFDRMISVVTGSKPHEVALKRFDFSDEELHHYGEVIRKGAILIIAQHDFPFEKQPTSYKFSKLPKSLPTKQIPTPLNISKKHEAKENM